MGGEISRSGFAHSQLTTWSNGTAGTFLQWEMKNPNLVAEMTADLQKVQACNCLIVSKERVWISLKYSGRYYAANADADYRVAGMKKMNTSINVTYERPSKSHAAAKAAAVMLTPFTATIDALMMPAHLIIRQGLKGVPHG